MGKFGIGARVRDRDGDEGVIVDKRKGERKVKYDFAPSGEGAWMYKSRLTPIASNDDEPAAQTTDPVAVAPATATPAFKVGDRVRVKGDDQVRYVALRTPWGSMSLSDEPGGLGGLCWWDDDELEPADTPASSDIAKGVFVALASPAIVTGIDRYHAHLQLASGGSYTLPVAALVTVA